VRGEVRWRGATLYLPLLLWVVAAFTAVLFSVDPGQSLFEVGDLPTLLLVPMTVTLIDDRRWDRLLMTLAFTVTISSLVGFWQYAHGASTLDSRIRGLTTHYMTFAGWTLVVVMLLVGDMLFHRDRRRLWWTAPGVVFGVVAIVLSYTRNAWVGLVVAVALAVTIVRPRLLLLGPIVALGVTLLLPLPLVDRIVAIVDLEDPSNHDRVCMAQSGLEMVSDRPLFGLGLGQVQARYSDYRRPDSIRERIPHLHSNVVQIAGERGLAGLAVYLAILSVFFARVITLLRRSSGSRARPAVIGALLAVVGVTVAGLFEYNWGDTEVWMVTLVALAVPFAKLEESS